MQTQNDKLMELSEFLDEQIAKLEALRTVIEAKKLIDNYYI